VHQPPQRHEEHVGDTAQELHRRGRPRQGLAGRGLDGGALRRCAWGRGRGRGGGWGGRGACSLQRTPWRPAWPLDHAGSYSSMLDAEASARLRACWRHCRRLRQSFQPAALACCWLAPAPAGQGSAEPMSSPAPPCCPDPETQVCAMRTPGCAGATVRGSGRCPSDLSNKPKRSAWATTSAAAPLPRCPPPARPAQPSSESGPPPRQRRRQVQARQGGGGLALRHAARSNGAAHARHLQAQQREGAQPARRGAAAAAVLRPAAPCFAWTG
jgi:hypothetical protein